MTYRALLSLVLVCFFATLAQDAFAQVLSVNAATIGRRGDRATQLKLTDISYADCVADDYFEVTVTPTNVTGERGMRIFSGTEDACSNSASRITLGPTKCWEVYSSTTVTTDPIRLKVRNILPHDQENAAATCDKGSVSTFGLHFLLFEGDKQLDAGGTKVAGKWDLLGPAAPTANSIGIGDGRLYPTWSASKEVSGGYDVYCESTGMTADPNAPPPTTCPVQTLMAGQVPPTDLDANTTTSPNSTEGEVSSLNNYEIYACGVSARDTFQNVGPISNLICGFPRPVDGYFKAYRKAGGQAGGGWCSFGRHADARWGAIGVLGLAAGLFLTRRRTRRAGVGR